MNLSTRLFLLLAIVTALGCGANTKPSPAKSDTPANDPTIEELVEEAFGHQDHGEQTIAVDDAFEEPVERKVPQEVIDAPTRKIVEKNSNGQPGKVFMGKVLQRNSRQSVIQHGPYEEFYLSGQRQKQGTYDYGQKTGEWRFWSKAGQLLKQGSYAQDKQVGEWKQFRDDGTLKWIEHYESGRASGLWRAFQPDGKALLWQRGYKNGDRHGRWEDYFSNGKIRSLETYAKGDLDGDAKRWNEDGVLVGEGTYKQGKRDGTFRSYKDGKLVEEEVWNDGIREFN